MFTLSPCRDPQRRRPNDNNNNNSTAPCCTWSAPLTCPTTTACPASFDVPSAASSSPLYLQLLSRVYSAVYVSIRVCTRARLIRSTAPISRKLRDLSCSFSWSSSSSSSAGARASASMCELLQRARASRSLLEERRKESRSGGGGGGCGGGGPPRRRATFSPSSDRVTCPVFPARPRAPLYGANYIGTRI